MTRGNFGLHNLPEPSAIIGRHKVQWQQVVAYAQVLKNIILVLLCISENSSSKEYLYMLYFNLYLSDWPEMRSRFLFNTTNVYCNRRAEIESIRGVLACFNFFLHQVWDLQLKTLKTFRVYQEFLIMRWYITCEFFEAAVLRQTLTHICVQ